MVKSQKKFKVLILILKLIHPLLVFVQTLIILLHDFYTVAFKLLLPQSVKILPLFHISLLKKFHGDQKQHYLPLPLTTNEFRSLIQPINMFEHLSTMGRKLSNG